MMVRQALVCLLIAASAAACRPPIAETQESETPPVTVMGEAPVSEPAPLGEKAEGSLSAEGQEIADCAGVFAAMGNIDPASTRNDASTIWFQKFAGIQMTIAGLEDRPSPALMSWSVRDRLEHWKAQ